MFKIKPDYKNLKTSLQLAKNRLKILQAKNSEQSQKKKAEIISYLKNGKFPQARISAPTAIRYESNSDIMSLIELFCDQLLERYVLFKEMKTAESSILIPVSNLIWIAPYFGSHVKELKVILKELTAKYGRKFRKKISKNKDGNVSSDLIKNVESINPSSENVEMYLKLICSENNIIYHEKEWDNNSLFNKKGRFEISDELNEALNDCFSRSLIECINGVDTFIRKEEAEENDEVVKNVSRTSVASTDVVESSFRNNVQESYQPTSSRNTLNESIDGPEADLNLEVSEMEEAAKIYVSVAKTDECDYSQRISYFPPSSNLYNNSHSYLDPPPSYNQCMNDSNEAYTKEEMINCTYQCPTCPSDPPDDINDIVKDAETKNIDA